MKYTKQDRIDGKCAIKWEDGKSQIINNLFYEATKSRVNGYFKYYYIRKMFGDLSSCDCTPDLPIVTIDELLNENQSFNIWN